MTKINMKLRGREIMSLEEVKEIILENNEDYEDVVEDVEIDNGRITKI